MLSGELLPLHNSRTADVPGSTRGNADRAVTMNPGLLPTSALEQLPTPSLRTCDASSVKNA